MPRNTHWKDGVIACVSSFTHFNIKVVIIEPGAIKTELSGASWPNMLDRCKGGVYEKACTKFARNMEKNEPARSHPSVTSNTISEAITLENPPRRYLVGTYAKPSVFIWNWFGDGVWDYLMLAATA